VPHSSESSKDSKPGSSKLENDLLDAIRGSISPRKHRTVEESLQDALDVTTPEQPGDPRDKKEEPERDEDEWI
jgi:hypothetical protein